MTMDSKERRRVSRRNWIAGLLFGLVAATAIGVWAVPPPLNKFSSGTKAKAQEVNENFAYLESELLALKAKVAKLETNPDCPPGYTKSTTVTSYTLCVNGKDEMVKVGDFWVDRYEMSIVDAKSYAGGKCNGSGTQYAISPGSDNYDAAGFPDWGKAATKLYACSRSGNKPSASMTWFQAAAACAFAGKHLCTNGEWQVAALGTPDDASSCNVSTSAPENAGNRAACISQSGAMDMVGNLWEWVDMWGQAGKVNTSFSSGASVTPWPSGYGDGKDGTWNVNGEAYDGSTWTTGMPAAALRGGYWGYGPAAGVFAVSLHGGPSSWDADSGARCCRQ